MYVGSPYNKPPVLSSQDRYKFLSINPIIKKYFLSIIIFNRSPIHSIHHLTAGIHIYWLYWCCPHRCCRCCHFWWTHYLRDYHFWWRIVLHSASIPYNALPELSIWCIIVQEHFTSHFVIRYIIFAKLLMHHRSRSYNPFTAIAYINVSYLAINFILYLNRHECVYTAETMSNGMDTYLFMPLYSRKWSFRSISLHFAMQFQCTALILTVLCDDHDIVIKIMMRKAIREILSSLFKLLAFHSNANANAGIHEIIILKHKKWFSLRHWTN